VAERAGEYELLLEMILEGSLLHYGAPRVLRVQDGLPKMKDMPKEMGGSGELVPE